MYAYQRKSKTKTGSFWRCNRWEFRLTAFLSISSRARILNARRISNCEKKLKERDLLLIESIDRLGRNYEGIIEQWRHITKVIRTDIRVLDMPLLDTTISKDLLGTFIADLVLQVLSFAAENERKNIRQRQREGIDAALARGVRFGRPGIPDSEAMLEAVRLYRQKKISLSRALDMSGIGRTTFYKKLKEFSA